MGEPASTVPAGSDNPQEQRECRDCGEKKTVTPETWPYKNDKKRGRYHPHGNRCKLCEAARVKRYEERRAEVGALVPAEPEPATKTAKNAARKDEVEQAKLDAAKSLKLGSRVLNTAAADVLTRILLWAEDEEHPEHRWANQFLAERILPRKLYEELGGQAAGVGQLGDKAPVFNIQILQAQPDAAPSRVLEHEPAQLVEVLPAPTE